jgi:hypothetical protein
MKEKEAQSRSLDSHYFVRFRGEGYLRFDAFEVRS